MEDRFNLFTVLITGISRSIKRIKTEEMKEFNLKSPHVSCLYYLYKEEKLTAKRLIDICDEDKASISRSIDYLEKNGFLFCNDLDKKRYNSYLFLTEKGKIIAKKICEKIDGVLSISSLGLTNEERSIMYSSLAIIANNLKKIEKGRIKNVD